VASVTADIVCRLIVGRLPVFHIQIARYPELSMFPYFVVLGILIGFLGLFFNKALMASSDALYRLSATKKVVFALLLGAVLGGVAFLAPESLGTGTELITNALSSQMLYQQLLIYFVLRFVFTMASYGTGAPGGIFAPLLLLGVLAGSFFGDAVSGFSAGAPFDFSVWAVLGMAGFFSAVVRAPITGTVLILEMTAAYDLLLPLMVVSIIAYGIPELFRDKPIYEALLHRDLERKRL
jgi:CIC family chloride channel protein